MKAFALALIFLLPLARAETLAPLWKPLFNGKNLDGWHPLPGGEWTVENGTLVGRSPATEKRHGLLLTDRTYANFVLQVKFRVQSGNSGLYFRSEKSGDALGVNGFQAEVDLTPATGGLYETGGREWVIKPDPELLPRLAPPGEWTQMTVTAIGDDISVSVNGVPVVQLPNDHAGRKEGHIALQLHGGDEMHVEFKDLHILPLP